LNSRKFFAIVFFALASGSLLAEKARNFSKPDTIDRIASALDGVFVTRIQISNGSFYLTGITPSPEAVRDAIVSSGAALSARLEPVNDVDDSPMDGKLITINGQISVEETEVVLARLVAVESERNLSKLVKEHLEMARCTFISAQVTQSYGPQFAGVMLRARCAGSIEDVAEKLTQLQQTSKIGMEDIVLYGGLRNAQGEESVDIRFVALAAHRADG
jgi:hypothetical protein